VAIEIPVSACSNQRAFGPLEDNAKNVSWEVH
jgi:hypothetical protein